MKKAQNIEEDEKKLSMSIVVVGDNVKEIQGNINIANENFRKQIIELKDEDEAIWKKIGDLNEDFGNIDIKIENVRTSESAQMKGQTEKFEDAIDGLAEKLKKLEGVSNENAEVINQFTINHLTFEEKMDTNFGDIKIVNNKQDQKLGKLEKLIVAVEEDTGKIGNVINTEIKPQVQEIKKDVTFVQGAVQKICLLYTSPSPRD